MDQEMRAFVWKMGAVGVLIVAFVVLQLLGIKAQPVNYADLAEGQWRLEERHCEIFGEPSREAIAVGYQCP